MGEQFKNNISREKSSDKEVSNESGEESVIPDCGREVMRISKVEVMGPDGKCPREGELHMSIKCNKDNPDGKKVFSQSAQFKPRK